MGAFAHKNEEHKRNWYEKIISKWKTNHAQVLAINYWWHTAFVINQKLMIKIHQKTKGDIKDFMA